MMENYSEQGYRNLLILDKAKSFINWNYGEIRPYLKGKILEIGSGIGTYSAQIVRDFPQSPVFLNDIDQDFIKTLEAKFSGYENIKIIPKNLLDAAESRDAADLFDSIVALNVFEHISDDVLALNNAYQMLAPGGRLIFQVPAHKFLYNHFDKVVGHYRRYSKNELMAKIRQTPFQIKNFFSFNFFSIPGWYIEGKIMKRKTISGHSIKCLNFLVPIFEFFEKYIFRKKIGISFIIILEKTLCPPKFLHRRQGEY